MRGAYALLGVGFLAIVAVVFYLGANSAEAPVEQHLPLTNTPMTFTLSSPEFEAGKSIPVTYTCDGDNTSPELHIEHVPNGTVSFALIVEDPDIPREVKERMGIDVFDHYVLFNIPADTTKIPTGNTTVGTPGNNTRGLGYTGPCPPREYEPREHRYVFQLFALDTMLDLPEGATKAQLKSVMNGHIIETAMLIGRYERPATTSP